MCELQRSFSQERKESQQSQVAAKRFDKEEKVEHNCGVR